MDSSADLDLYRGSCCCDPPPPPPHTCTCTIYGFVMQRLWAPCLFQKSPGRPAAVSIKGRLQRGEQFGPGVRQRRQAVAGPLERNQKRAVLGSVASVTHALLWEEAAAGWQERERLRKPHFQLPQPPLPGRAGEATLCLWPQSCLQF